MPAFWLYITKAQTVPFWGEIDVVEVATMYRKYASSSLHGNTMNGTGVVKLSIEKEFVNDGTTFNTFTVDWNADRLLYYHNDKLVMSMNKTSLPAKVTSWPFDIPLNIILNTAVGGPWAGSQGIDDGSFPNDFVTDYVRQYSN